MKCIDEESLDVFGNYDTSQASNFQIILQKCDRELRTDCKSEEEIDKWL